MNTLIRRQTDMAAALLIGSVFLCLALISCGGGQAEVVNPDSGSVDSSLPLPESYSLAGIDRAEADMRASTRDAVRDQLGRDAEAMFTQLDTARTALLIQAQSKMQNTGNAGAGNDLSGNLLPSGNVLASFRRPMMKQKVAMPMVIRQFVITPGMIKNDGTYQGAFPYSEGSAAGQLNFTFTRAGSRTTGNYEMTITTTGPDGAVLMEKAKGTLEMDSCPDEHGEVPVKFTIMMDTEGSSPTGKVGLQFDISSTAKGFVNDEAGLSRIETDGTVGVSQQTQVGSAPPATGFAEVHTTKNLSGMDTAGAEMSGQWERTRASSNVSDDTRNAAKEMSTNLPFDLAMGILVLGESGWTDGYCVQIVVDGVQDSNEVNPSETRPFTGKVRHKFEGTELHVPLQGTLSGDRELNPAGKNNAPVSFTYKAPDQDDQLATVNLETRSKRGADKKAITFKTKKKKPYTASGGSKMKMSGTICDLEAPFQLEAVGQNGLAYHYSFTPGGPTAGSFSYSGSGGGCTESGNGVYSIDLSADKKGGTVNLPSNGNISCPSVSSNYSDTVSFNLAEAPPGSCRSS